MLKRGYCWCQSLRRPRPLYPCIYYRAKFSPSRRDADDDKDGAKGARSFYPFGTAAEGHAGPREERWGKEGEEENGAL